MAAIAEQSQKLDQVIFAVYTHEPAEDVARGLIAIAPTSLTRVFFSDNGSPSVEVALKMALGHWHNRGESPHRTLVLEHSYHGDTLGPYRKRFGEGKRESVRVHLGGRLVIKQKTQ